jgi:hypothetical protein
LRTLCRIESYLSVLYLFAKEFVRYNVGTDDIDWPAKHRYERVMKRVNVAHVTIESLRLELNPDIDIAAVRIEVIPDCGAKDGQATYMVPAAQLGDLIALRCDEVLHGLSFPEVV